MTPFLRSCPAEPDIPFLDLRSVNADREGEIRDVMQAVVSRGRYVGGQEVKLFEAAWAAYCGVPHCVAVGNGFDALRLLLRASGLEPGDEVLVPANTFIATILAVLDAGLKPVLVEPDPATYLMDPARAAECITSRTRALMAVHLYGNCDGAEGARELARRHGLLFLEDAAQAHGAVVAGQKAGALGAAAGFSFYPTKNLGALGDAGAVTTGQARLAQDVHALRDYGADRRNEYRLQGFNSRLDELQAAVLRVKLAYLDDDTQRRREIAVSYLSRVRNPRIALPAAGEPSSHVWHLFVVRTADRPALRLHLARCGIGSAIHYPVPAHRQVALAAYRDLHLPVTERLHREVLSIPLNTALTDTEVERIVEALNTFDSPPADQGDGRNARAGCGNEAP